MAEHPQFQYWSMVLNLELLVLNLVGSIRSGDFQQYMKSIQELIPWSFAVDHINYSRSLSIHLRDTTSLSTLQPSVYAHFCEGRFVAHRTMRSFSGMALDQAPEQLNALVKWDGGAVGLTENACCSPEEVGGCWTWDITHDPRVGRLLSTTWIRASYEIS